MLLNQNSMKRPEHREMGLERPNHTIEPQRLGHQSLHTRCLCFLENPLRIGQGMRQRLFHNKREPAPRRPRADLRVKVGGDHDRDRIQSRIPQQVAIVRIEGETLCRGELLAPLPILPADGNELCFGDILDQMTGVSGPVTPEPDQSKSDPLPCHDSPMRESG